MIFNFAKVNDQLYRGSAPSPKDLLELKQLGIKKIISLDKLSGEKIDRAAKLLGIEHIMMPIDFRMSSLINLCKHNFKKLFLEDGPTFVHCLHGKDRTGLVVALIQCKYFGMSHEDAIKEAESFGFGIGVDPTMTHLYKKIIRSCKSADENNADIVSNEREYHGDKADSYLDSADRISIAPFSSTTRQYPYDLPYNSVNDQTDTRENYKAPPAKFKDKADMPLVGIFNNEAGISGAGPTVNSTGFI